MLRKYICNLIYKQKTGGTFCKSFSRSISHAFYIIALLVVKSRDSHLSIRNGSYDMNKDLSSKICTKKYE